MLDTRDTHASHVLFLLVSEFSLKQPLFLLPPLLLTLFNLLFIPLPFVFFSFIILLLVVLGHDFIHLIAMIIKQVVIALGFDVCEH